MALMASDSRVKDVRSLPLVADIGLEDNSPFGVQGLSRESLQLLKGASIKPLAAALALSANRDQMRDPVLRKRFLRGTQAGLMSTVQCGSSSVRSGSMVRAIS